MRYRVIYNPHARGGKGAALASRCLALLRQSDHHIDAVEVPRFQDAATLSLEANRDGYDAVVAIGGDGTINRVLNGFYDDNGSRISHTRFGVVHTGTSPDFCKSYGVPLGLEAAVQTLLRGKTQRIPVGMIRFLPHAHEAGGGAPVQSNGVSYFVCCANIGLGASLATHANAGIRRRLGDTLGTLVSLLRVLRTYEPEDIALRIDEQEVDWKRVYNISVGLTPYIASGIRIDNRPMRAQKRFYVMVLRDMRLRNLPALLAKIYSGKSFRDTAYLSLGDCASLSVPQHHRPSDVEHDGDPCGHLPCAIEMARDELDLIS